MGSDPGTSAFALWLTVMVELASGMLLVNGGRALAVGFSPGVMSVVVGTVRGWQGAVAANEGAFDGVG